VANIEKKADSRRYTALKHLHTPDGKPILCADHDYITIWGFWNGPDELLAARDGQYYRGINARQACPSRFITRKMLDELLKQTKKRLAKRGFDDLRLKRIICCSASARMDKMVEGYFSANQKCGYAILNLIRKKSIRSRSSPFRACLRRAGNPAEKNP